MGLFSWLFGKPKDESIGNERNLAPRSPDTAYEPGPEFENAAGHDPFDPEHDVEDVRHETQPAKDSPKVVFSFEDSSWEEVNDVVFSPDGRRALAACKSGDVVLFDLENGEAIHHVAHDKSATCVAFSADGLIGASGSEDCTVRLWDLQSGNEVNRFVVHDVFSPNHVGFSKKGPKIVAHGLFGLFAWGLTGKKPCHTNYSRDFAVQKLISVENTVLVVSATREALEIWDYDRGHSYGRFSVPNALGFIRADLSLDLQVFAAGIHRSVRIWKKTSGSMGAFPEVPLQFDAHKSDIVGVSLSGDGKRLLTASDAYLPLHDRGNRQTGKYRKSLALWNAETGKGICRFGEAIEESWMDRFATVTCVALSADGQRALVGYSDGALRLWDLSLGTQQTQTALTEAPVHGNAASTTHRAKIELVPELATLLQDEDKYVRLGAVTELGRIRTKESEAALSVALNHTDGRIRVIAARSLWRFNKHAASVSLLAEHIRHFDVLVQSDAFAALKDIGPEAKEAVPALVDALTDEESSIRIGACEVLSVMGPTAQQAVPALIDILNDEDPQVASSAAEALKQIDPEVARKAAIPSGVLEALQRGQRIEAIKIYRAATSVGLAEAKRFVDGIQTETLTPKPEV